MNNTRPTFSAEFKLEAAQLVTEQNYSIQEAATAMAVSNSAMRKWVKQLQQEHQGISPKGSPITPEQQRIRELEKKLRRIEEENTILKKATVDSTGQCNSFTKILICIGVDNDTTKKNLYEGRKRAYF